MPPIYFNLKQQKIFGFLVFSVSQKWEQWSGKALKEISKKDSRERNIKANINEKNMLVKKCK